MCGSYVANKEPENWLGGFYQVFPVEGELPEMSRKWDGVNLGTLKEMFPDGLDAYCLAAFIYASVENQEWAGATYDYLDRLAVGGLRREHGKVSRGCLRKWIWSFGRTKELSGTDVLVLLTGSFTHLFWNSMRGLVSKGYVRVERREMYDIDADVFFPTERLIRRINRSLENYF